MILTVQTENHSYDIIEEPGVLRRAGELLRLDRKVLIVTDDGVPSAYAETVAAASADPVICRVAQGEGSKSVATWQSLLETMLEHGFTRTDCVVAVGGGVVGDLAGFCAASFMRGVDFYNIPTTVLSQVDSSIGGKTAVNLGQVKNIVGAFYPPRRVLIDTDLLATLPRRQIANGLAEAVKMALTSDASLFETIERTGNPADILPEIIERAIRIKKRVVEADEKESGIRKILNFGHTIGHGIESRCGGDLFHGECVALGMLPMCSASVRERLIPVLKKIGLPTTTAACRVDPSAVFDALTHDKKADGQDITIITVKEIGTCDMEKVPVATLAEKLRYFENAGGQAHE